MCTKKTFYKEEYGGKTKIYIHNIYLFLDTKGLAAKKENFS